MQMGQSLNILSRLISFCDKLTSLKYPAMLKVAGYKENGEFSLCDYQNCVRIY